MDKNIRILFLWGKNLPMHLDFHQPKSNLATKALKNSTNNSNRSQNSDDNVPPP